MTCPNHHETHYCPLYLAMHYPDGLGCGVGASGCQVARGRMNYSKAVARFESAHPGECQRLADKEFAERGAPLWVAQ
jgi:hypothetical protein